MIKVVLIDDELPALDELSFQLQKFDQIQIAAQFTDPFDALKEIEYIKPDAVFLDIDMPILDGLSLAAELLKRNPRLPIIFVTAYNEYALQAFDVNAVDYIVKPVRLSRLDQTIEKLQKHLENNLYSNEKLLDQLSELRAVLNKSPEKLVSFDGDTYHFIVIDEVVYIEAQVKNTAVVTTYGAYTARTAMNVMEEQLKRQGFFRCHRSYMINPKYITKIMRTHNDTFQIELNHSPVIPVSKSHTLEVKNLIESKARVRMDR